MLVSSIGYLHTGSSRNVSTAMKKQNNNGFGHTDSRVDATDYNKGFATQIVSSIVSKFSKDSNNQNSKCISLIA